MGALPPMSAEEWDRVFQLYRTSSEYKLANAGMSLGEFKLIFFWEWFHRALGRLVGLVYFIPLVYFQFRGRLSSRSLSLKLWIGLILGGSQGVLGWYMVQSGLVDRVDVSHFRLAAHLCLALAIFCYLYWILLDLIRGTSKSTSPSSLLPYSISFLALLSLQIVWGAFTAGLKAGYGHNTFPDMSGRFFPAEGLLLEPTWLNFFQTHATVQFTHRTLGWSLLLCGIVLIVKTIKYSKQMSVRGPVLLTLSLLCLQFLLGVGVIVLKVPLELAVLHQSGAFFLLFATITLTHLHRYPKSV